MKTTQQERTKKLLLFLPLLVLPFMALGFYALGGGKGDAQERGAGVNPGINTALPGAQLKKDAQEDKMALYDKAAQDSVARSKAGGGAFAALGWDTAMMRKSGGTPVNNAAASEAKIKEKLAEINRQISKPEPLEKLSRESVSAGLQDDQLSRVEALLKQKQEAAEPDPALQVLNGMLDKIREIQHPALVDGAKVELGHRDSAFHAIPALIDGTQKVAPGGVVRLKLADSALIGGLVYPKGQLLSGACNVTNQRLLLDIRNVRLGTSIVPVSLTVFSMDGMAGIPAPEAELGMAAGQGASEAVSGMEFLPMDNSLSVQAATAGISAAKSLLSKKARRIRVKLHGGQMVLLRINKS